VLADMYTPLFDGAPIPVVCLSEPQCTVPTLMAVN
jgi:hypothetical protein